jgi:protein-S-isoprenylcysteine O-methyltransferase Ste14
VRFFFFLRYKIHYKVQESTHNRREIIVSIWLGVFYILPACLWIGSTWIDFAQIGFFSCLRWLGVGISVISIWIFYLSHAQLGKHWSPLLETHSEHTIIRQGLYKYVRHPMYSSLLLGLLGTLFMTNNWLATLLMSIGVFVFIFLRLPREEAFMQARFGADYLAYQRQTKRLFPFIW